jgi:hypothetical protein
MAALELLSGAQGVVASTPGARDFLALGELGWLTSIWSNSRGSGSDRSSHMFWDKFDLSDQFLGPISGYRVRLAFEI